MTNTLALTSRLTYLERPKAHPGQCLQCGSATRPVIDTGLTIKWHGAIYFCVTCVEEMGRAVNMVPKALLEESERAEKEVVDSYLKSRGLVTVDGYTFSKLTRIRDIVISVIDGNSDHFIQDSRVEQEVSGTGESSIPQQPRDTNQLLLDTIEFSPITIGESDDSPVSEGPNVVSDGGNSIFQLE